MIESLVYFILWISIAFFLYNYFGYPLLLKVMAYGKPDHHNLKIPDAQELSHFPKVSFIIAAYNEEKVIERKLKNTFELDYPQEQLEIIVVSDGSDDNTAQIVQGFSARVVGLHDPKRAGKSAALNRAVEQATGEILLFSDANNDFSRDAIKQLVRHFEDDAIGAVTGAKHIYANDEREAAVGDGLYWRYESAIKRLESQLGSITAAEGEILALRRECFNPIDPFKVNDDAAITFDIVKTGRRVLYEENAKSSEQASIDLVDDINVKIRMTFGGFQTTRLESRYLFPPTHWFAFTFISHKLLRWLAPHFLLAIFICSVLLWQDSFVNLLLLAQVVFYSIAVYGWKHRDRKLAALVYIPMYFSVMNYALFRGFLRYLENSNKVQWKKAAR